MYALQHILDRFSFVTQLQKELIVFISPSEISAVHRHCKVQGSKQQAMPYLCTGGCD